MGIPSCCSGIFILFLAGSDERTQSCSPTSISTLCAASRNAYGAIANAVVMKPDIGPSIHPED